MNAYKSDRLRKGANPSYQYWLRKTQQTSGVLNVFCKAMFVFTRFLYSTDISSRATIGPGLYIGHPFCITINGNAVLGKNCNIHKGVTIGQENRGHRKGAPTIGDCVWIGINSTITGKVSIGDDVLIAPNSYVNCDVPPHSVVFGNPCIIKHRDNATEGYIGNKI